MTPALDALKRTLRGILATPEWVSDVGPESLRRDALAGLSVAVLLVPQAMAYATLAGLPPIYGLYASLVPLIVYPWFGTARQLAVGVVALDMLILGAGLIGWAEPGSEAWVALAVTTALCVGVIQIGMGVLRLGFLADLLSRPVITGFTAAAALVIAASQLGPLLGIELGRSERVHELLLGAWAARDTVHLPTATLGGAALLLMLAIRRWVPKLPGALIVVAAGTLIAGWAGLADRGLQVVGSVPAGLPLPEIGFIRLDAIPDLLPLAATLALVQLMSAISIGRTLSSRHGDTVRPNRELLGLGFANLFGSLFRSPPVSASFSRSAVNDDAGARTPLSNVVAAGVVVVTLLFLTPVFAHLPRTVLAAIIVVSALGLVRPGDFLDLVRVDPRDGSVAALTALATLGLGIQEGVVIGIVTSVLLVLWRFSRPNISELGHVSGTQIFRDLARFESAEPLDGLLIVRVDAAFSFFNAAYFRDHVLDREHRTGDRPEIRAVILEARGVNDVDTTAVDALRELVATLRARDVELHIAGLKGPVRDILQRANGAELPDSRFHLSTHHAVERIYDGWRNEGRDWTSGYAERTAGSKSSGNDEGGPLT